MKSKKHCLKLDDNDKMTKKKSEQKGTKTKNKKHFKIRSIK